MAFEEEYEAVTLKLPRKIVDFMRALGVDVEDYASAVVINSLRADLEVLDRSPLVNLDKFGLRQFIEGSRYE